MVIDADLHHLVAKLSKAVANLLGVGKLIDSGLPGVRNESLIDDGGIGVIDREELQTQLSGEAIAIIVFIGVGRAGGEGLAGKFFLVSIAAEMIFLFQQQKILAAQKVRR